MAEPQRRIRALYGASTITVHQAYPPEIGLPAAREGRFPAAWKRDRMTWVKACRFAAFSASRESRSSGRSRWVRGQPSRPWSGAAPADVFWS
ncbi:DUF4291 family protein [Streptomyces bobili]|uniref:DUF4291 family protein n=1 Tax=Streptomyces bobili TaxID=67280 RepID=UPI0036FDBEBD